jgi:uncharacterized repeat protein (TIGR01451 family)
VRVLVVLAAAAFMLLAPAGSYAVHDVGLFELDGNTVDNSAPVAGNNAPYDWESVFDSSGIQVLTSAAEPRLLTAAFSADTTTPDASYFASSNKDIDDVSTWQCGVQNNPLNKDDIRNAYAALFKNTADGHVILYAGVERDSNNGNSFAGFWIFKGNVGCNSPGNFSGQHTDGDVLILSNFTGGGGTPLVQVYEWMNGGLTLVDSGNFCSAAGSGDDVCGEVNAASFTPAWDSGALDTNQFLEVGVDLTSALDFGANSVPCFARFQAETRSSQETTATLKDFAGGQFNTCSSSTVTTPMANGSSVSNSSVGPGTSVTDRAVITGTADVGTAPKPTGSVSFFLCGPTQAPTSCSTGGDAVGSAVNLSGSDNPATVNSSAVSKTAPGWYCFRAEYSGDSNYPASKDSSTNECFQVVDANIQISPGSATNPTGTNHVLTITVNAVGGTIGAGPHTATASIVSGPGSFVGSPTCTYTGGAATASCQVTITSAAVGTTVVSATSAIPVNGVTITRTTGTAANTTAGGSGNASKTWVDANIQITPASATNPIGTNHVLTITVNAVGGTIGAGPHTATASIVSGPGSFVGSPTCTYTGGSASASCQVTITSATAGTTVVSATSDIPVNGVTITRTTGTAANTAAGGSGNASKSWASAMIVIAPSATNEVGHAHTFTVTLSKDSGTGSFVPAQGEHVSVTLTDSGGASHSAPTGSCMTAGPNTDANGQCTITFVSSAAGKVTGHASATLTINGASITVSTDGVAPNSADAVKTFVDANVQISPPSAINPVGKNHTFTGHVNVNTGSGGFVNAPNGTTISFVLTGAGSFVGPSSCTTAGGTGSCTVVIVSSAPGSSSVKAKTDVVVGGLTLHRESGDAKPGDSADASKLWADATARTDILNAAGAVVTTVVSGTVVHDKVFVDRLAGTPAGVPNPTGNVIFHRYTTIDCTGAATDQTVALTAGAPSTALSADFAPTANMSYKADYLGDANYPARSGACEPLTVTPVPAPAIAIVKNPKSQTVAVGGTATFSITVTNAGNTVLTNVTVTDPLSPNCNRTSAQIPALASMAPGATVTYTCTRPNVRANFDNIATATGTPPSGPNVTATDTAPVKTKALTPKKIVKKKKKPKVVSHKKPKATG